MRHSGAAGRSSKVGLLLRRPWAWSVSVCATRSGTTRGCRAGTAIVCSRSPSASSSSMRCSRWSSRCSHRPIRGCPTFTSRGGSSAQWCSRAWWRYSMRSSPSAPSSTSCRASSPPRSTTFSRRQPSSCSKRSSSLCSRPVTPRSSGCCSSRFCCCCASLPLPSSSALPSSPACWPRAPRGTCPR